MAEARLLADALKTDTHVRVQVAEELSEWMRREENDPDDFPELERLVGALAVWMGSSNHKVTGGPCRAGVGVNWNRVSWLFSLVCVL